MQNIRAAAKNERAHPGAGEGAQANAPDRRANADAFQCGKAFPARAAARIGKGIGRNPVRAVPDVNRLKKGLTADRERVSVILQAVQRGADRQVTEVLTPAEKVGADADKTVRKGDALQGRTVFKGAASQNLEAFLHLDAGQRWTARKGIHADPDDVRTDIHALQGIQVSETGIAHGTACDVQRAQAVHAAEGRGDLGSTGKGKRQFFNPCAAEGIAADSSERCGKRQRLKGGKAGQGIVPDFLDRVPDDKVLNIVGLKLEAVPGNDAWAVQDEGVQGRAALEDLRTDRLDALRDCDGCHARAALECSISNRGDIRPKRGIQNPRAVFKCIVCDRSVDVDPANGAAAIECVLPNRAAAGLQYTAVIVDRLGHQNTHQ